VTKNSPWDLEKVFTHFRRRGDGFIGLRTVVFDAKRKISQGNPLRTLRMEFDGTWRSFVSCPTRCRWSDSVPTVDRILKTQSEPKSSREDGSFINWLTIKNGQHAKCRKNFWKFWEMTNPYNFRMLPQDMNLISRIVTNSLAIMYNPVWKCCQKRRQQLPQKELS
jgi:hypothetical protein